MRECTFIFKNLSRWIAFLFFLSFHLTGTQSRAQDAPVAVPPGPGKTTDGGTFLEPNSPYLEYGEFSFADDEEHETLFYQYGRFFGVSLGAGYQTALGNRGKLYDAAIPRTDLKVHYWFDFDFALTFGIFFANHNFVAQNQAYKVNLIGYGADLRFYFNVKDLGAAFTFAQPYLIGGAGAMSKTQTRATANPDTDSTFSVGLGGGLEFPIVHRSSYVQLEARYSTQNFDDTNTSNFSDRVEDLSGGFFSLMVHLMFVW